MLQVTLAIIIVCSSHGVQAQMRASDLQLMPAQLPDAALSPRPGPSDGLIFDHDFESGDLRGWDETPARYAIERDRNKVHAGSFALRGRVGPGVPLGQLNKWFMPGYDEIYVKFHVMFETGYVDKSMHFIALFGNRVDNKWSGSGQAGIKPDGNDYFYIGVEPENPSMHGGRQALWPFMLYAYWPEMECPTDYDRMSRRNCYGNYLLQSGPKVATVAGIWHELVMHVKLNAPGFSNGSVALWVDGTQKYEKLNMRFRNTTQLRLNQFSIQLYAPNAPKLEHVWFDDVKIWRPGKAAPLPARRLQRHHRGDVGLVLCASTRR